jgi:hypothetical protein
MVCWNNGLSLDKPWLVSIHVHLPDANGFYEAINYIGSYFHPDLTSSPASMLFPFIFSRNLLCSLMDRFPGILC